MAPAFAIETFGYNHDYVFVQHLDDKHPHVHLTVESLGHDGRRLNPRKTDLQACANGLPESFGFVGSRRRQHRDEPGGEFEKPTAGRCWPCASERVAPEVDRLAREEILREVRGGKTTERPWENRIMSRQDAIRQRYLDYAAELQRSGTARDDALARQIRQFIKDMPAVETRRQVLTNELSELADSRRRGAEEGVNADRRGETRGDERTGIADAWV